MSVKVSGETGHLVGFSGVGLHDAGQLMILLLESPAAGPHCFNFGHQFKGVFKLTIRFQCSRLFQKKIKPLIDTDVL